MIPIRLELKNFISYGPDIQTIDFSPYQLICLSGKNGHGKSALLDAITWATWGQARKVSGNAKADQGLLRLGQTQMMVCLDFELNNQRYRVRREFAQTYGKPYAALDFGLLGDDDAYIPLTDKTISGTQAKIEQTINLSYESFINSAFLRQGQANEFSKKSPKDRKEILANILGLNQYEDVRKLAMEKSRGATLEKVNRETFQEKMELTLATKPLLEQQLQSLVEKSQAVETQEAQLQLQKKGLEEEHKIILDNRNSFQMLSFQIGECLKKEQEAVASFVLTAKEWRLIHQRQISMPDPRELESKRQIIITAIKHHQENLQKNLEFKEQILSYKEKAQKLTEKIALADKDQQLTFERLKLEKQTTLSIIQDLAERIKTIHTEITAIDSNKNICIEKVKNHQRVAQTYARIEKQFEKRKEYYQKFVEQGRWVTQELENLEQKKGMVHSDDDPSCPLCEQNLSAARKRFLKNKFTSDEQLLRHRHARLSSVVKRLKAILIEQHKEFELIKKQAEDLRDTSIKLEEYAKTSTKLILAIEDLTKHQTEQEIKINLIDQKMGIHQAQNTAQAETPSQKEYKEIGIKIAELEHESNKTLYNHAEHQKSATELQKIESDLNNLTLLKEQATLQAEREKNIAHLNFAIKVIRVEKTTYQNKLLAFADLDKKMALFMQKYNESKTIEQVLVKEKELMQHEKGRLENQSSSMSKIEIEHKENKTLIGTYNQEIADYQAIASATGKDGIQALLIEDAIPEIEQEANYLLSKLTNNQAHIFIESLRDLKKGGTKETLDIKISDATGIRPYELFSGGEAFRIDFALRIAISKLLARRAGTSLQTLIIDEGFGSQDEEGLGLIMDALYKIQEDFSKIIIVSHLPSMKDQFPVHFFIEKGPHGSSIQVIENG